MEEKWRLKQCNNKQSRGEVEYTTQETKQGKEKGAKVGLN